MDIIYCDGKLLKRMLVAGGRWLSLHRGVLNELNVFPVPDGDTGTNMTLTMRGALMPLMARHSSNSVGDTARAAARGALLGARGNSGVILSQILHGFASGLENLPQASTKDLARAFSFACKYAYNSVQTPREGTILTVVRKMTECAQEQAEKTPQLEDFFTAITKTARESLIAYRDELPELKNAGVVDAGGLGLVLMFEGMHKVTQGQQLTVTHDIIENPMVSTSPAQHALESEITFRYCTEFLIEGTAILPEDIRPALEKLGNSIVLARTQDLLKVHIHTNSPDLVEALVTPNCRKVKRKVEDMREQNKQRRENFKKGITPAQAAEATPEFKSELQVIETPTRSQVDKRALPPMAAIAGGEGLAEYFKSWNIEVIPGGQTTNPSTGDILVALNKTAKNYCLQHQEPLPEILLFANNSNCIAAAKQAGELCTYPVRVIPSKCPSQTVAFLNEGSSDGYKDLAERLHRGEITQAAKDADVQGQVIKTGDYLAFWDGQLVEVCSDVQKAVFALMANPPKKIFTRLVLVTGKDLDPEEVEVLLTDLLQAFPSVNIEFLWGGQPFYPILASLE